MVQWKYLEQQQIKFKHIDTERAEFPLVMLSVFAIYKFFSAFRFLSFSLRPSQAYAMWGVWSSAYSNAVAFKTPACPSIRHDVRTELLFLNITVVNLCMIF